MKRGLDESLRAVFRAGDPVEPAARDRLEAALLSEFDRRHPVRPRSVRWVRGALVTAVGLVLVGFGAQAPAAYSIDAGRRIELRLRRGERPPSRDSLQALLGKGNHRQLQVQVRRTPDGEASLEIDVWGDSLPTPDALRRQIEASWPGMDLSSLVILPMDGRVRDTLAGKVRWELFRLGANPEALHQARADLIQRIQREEGEGAKVEVKVDDESGERRVEIRVERRELREER